MLDETIALLKLIIEFKSYEFDWISLGTYLRKYMRSRMMKYDDQKYSLLRYPLNSCLDVLKVCIANYPEEYNFLQKM